MKVPGIHDPDPNHPKGMAWWFAAGICDPRPGGYPKGIYPNQQWALKQSWEPTSQMMWDLGFRWHPELATKWLSGGGQFALAQIVTEPPEEASMEELVEQFAAEQFEAMKVEIDRVKRVGSKAEKDRLKQRFKMNLEQNEELAHMLEDAVKNLPDENNADLHDRRGNRKPKKAD